ncbi:transcriptional initiation protein Tat [Acidisphaera sp. S103]|uniref:thiosulfate dehydrogenase n=1 Tax=Acidisphaera sp. S103 TaxID=1747223 RepID=UPI00131CDF9E|nr:transcriptional initiation protein Tat [Acidisphaera sp. S103]
MLTPRRQSLKTLGIALAAVGTAAAAPAETLVPAGASTLEVLTKRLAALPRRRDFKTVPMILDHRDQWDAEALDAVLHYAGGPKQAWNNTDIHGPWLNVMRNSINSEVWSFRHPEFLCVSATHGPAQFALYDDAMWEKYGLAKLAGGNITHNSFAVAPPAAEADPKDFQNPKGAFSSAANSIPALQRRGAVFLACHNAVWEHAQHLIALDTNPDKLSVEAMCAELSNHLIQGVVLTPGAVGTLAELGKAGFSYAQ